MAIPTQGLRHVPLKGFLYMVGGIFFLAVMDAAAKWLTAGYPVPELMFLGRLPGPFFAVALALANGGLGTLKTQKIGWHFVRAVFSVGTMGFFFYALKLLPLADTACVRCRFPSWARRWARGAGLPFSSDLRASS